MADSITIQYLAGCPGTALARSRIDEALRRLGATQVTITVQEIADQADAEHHGFRGSPTLLIDGVDPFAECPAVAAFACRIYATPSGTDVSPSVQQLVEALAAPSAVGDPR